MNPPAYDLAPLATLLALGALIALLPLAFAWRRRRGRPGGAMLRALTLMTLFLTFDLIVFGAFTRLTDSGLGCPDWPGCYGHASPLGAQAAIGAAQAVMPTGPVTHGKAWIEMVHRYLATAVGALITLLAICQGLRSAADRRSRSPRPSRTSGGAGRFHALVNDPRATLSGDRPLRSGQRLPLGVAAVPRGRGPASFGWAAVTLVWVCVQGAFGALTVTTKLYPAVVTAHLLGGLALLALLAVQAQLQVPPWARFGSELGRGVRACIAMVLALTVIQVALGGWVSTNYAVLACGDFPTCQGRWWPQVDFADGFTLLRALGQTSDGNWLPFPALTAIHLAHRLGAAVLVLAMTALVVRLAVSKEAEARRWALALVGVTAWQVASGLGNVLLGWPLASAVAHTAGAAAMVGVLTTMLTRSRRASSRADEGRSPQGLVVGSGMSAVRAS